MDKPKPIGLVPSYIRREQRIKEIIQAIIRYVEVEEAIPDEWFMEIGDLIRQNREWAESIRK